jgi:phospholipid/cholesterol/gamma-HCH transport system substrate-binding protein
MAVKANRVIRVIVIFIIAIASAGFLYLLINNFQFTQGMSVRVHFSSVGDLVGGAWVRKAGIKVGSVTKLEPAQDEKTVIVTLTLKPGQIVRTADKFALISKGILGDMYIEQNPGPKDSPLAAQGELFEGEPAFSLNDILGGGAMNAVTDLVTSIKKISDILGRNADSLDSTIRDLQKTVANARVISESVAEVSKTMPKLTDQVVSSMNRLEKTVNDFSDATGRVIVKLEENLTVGSSDLASSLKTLKNTTDDIQVMVDQLNTKNSVIGMLASPQTSQSLTATLTNLEEMSSSLTNSSVIGLLASSETSQSLSTTLKNLQDMSASLLKATKDAQDIVGQVKTLLATP